MTILGLTLQISLAGDYNDLILEQVKQMPTGGHYSVSHFAKIRLQSSAHFESGKFFIIPSGPSFCSGATYLVFIRTIEALRERGQLRLDYSTLERLIIRDQPDGQSVRYWSSNVPSGYGEKCVPRSKIAYAIFSRLETPANLTRINNAPFVDTYLASLLRSRSSISEAGAKCGL